MTAIDNDTSCIHASQIHSCICTQRTNVCVAWFSIQGKSGGGPVTEAELSSTISEAGGGRDFLTFPGEMRLRLDDD